MGDGKTKSCIIKDFKTILWYRGGWGAVLQLSQEDKICAIFILQGFLKPENTVLPFHVNSEMQRAQVEGISDPEFTRITSLPLARCINDCSCFLVERVPKEPEQRLSNDTATVET